MMRRKMLAMALALAGAALPAAGRAAPVVGAFTEVPFDDLSPNPTGIKMYYYVPSSGTAPRPIVVAIHYCTGTASAMFGWTELKSLSDSLGFMLVFPDVNRTGQCWDVASDDALAHPSNSDPAGIVAMVNHAVQNLDGDPDRVFALGQSSGAMMTNVLLGDYPDVFKAGAAFMGVPWGCFHNAGTLAPPAGSATTPGSTASGWNSTCSGGTLTHTAAEWGDLVRNAYSGYTGARPRMQVWHGSQDDILRFPNFSAEIAQWTNVLGVSGTAEVTEFPASTWTRTRYGGTGPQAPVEAIRMANQGHISPPTGVAAEMMRFFGLGDSAAPGAPTNVATSDVTSEDARLTWTAPTDNVAVAGYVVFRKDGAVWTPIAWPTGASYALVGLTPSTSYSFQVVARDRAGNLSTAATVDLTTADAPSSGGGGGGGCSHGTSSSAALLGLAAAIHFFTRRRTSGAR